MATSTKARTTKAPTVAEIDWTATFTAALNSPGALGNTYNRFYNYSFLNQIRLLMQGVNEPVATYRRWLELGRQVQKGSKAKTVLAPILVTKRDKETGKPILTKTGATQQVLVGFRDSNTVFGFSDTDGDELPEIVLPAWNADTALTALGVKRTKFRHLDGNTQGYSTDDDKGKRVAVNPAAPYPAKTLLHELAHIVLGHCKALTDQTGEFHRGIAEFEAESVAYLVATELQLKDWNPSESRGYITHWLENEGHDPEGSNGDAFDDKNVSRIFSAANKILVAGRTTTA